MHLVGFCFIRSIYLYNTVYYIQNLNSFSLQWNCIVQSTNHATTQYPFHVISPKFVLHDVLSKIYVFFAWRKFYVPINNMYELLTYLFIIVLIYYELFTYKICPECFNIIGHPELLVFGGKVKILGSKSWVLSVFPICRPTFPHSAPPQTLSSLLPPIPRHCCKSLGSPPLQISRLTAAANPNHAWGHKATGSTVVSSPMQIVRFPASP